MGLTELLEVLQVNDVLSCSVTAGTDEEVGLLQDEVALFPLLGVQHGFVAQDAHPLELTGQQTVTTDGGGSLRSR